MAFQIQKHYSLEEFEHFIQGQMSDKVYEYIAGEIHEVVSNNYSSEIASIINFFIRLFLRNSGLMGHVTGADGGYIIAGERYIPEVAYTTHERQPYASTAAYNPLPPDLAVEVLSPTNDDIKMRVKITNFLSVGTTVWLVNPDNRTVEVYRAHQPVLIIQESEILEGGDILPGFQLPVKDIFPELKEA